MPNSLLPLQFFYSYVPTASNAFPSVSVCKVLFILYGSVQIVSLIPSFHPSLRRCVYDIDIHFFTGSNIIPNNIVLKIGSQLAGDKKPHSFYELNTNLHTVHKQILSVTVH